MVNEGQALLEKLAQFFSCPSTSHPNVSLWLTSAINGATKYDRITSQHWTLRGVKSVNGAKRSWITMGDHGGF